MCKVGDECEIQPYPTALTMLMLPGPLSTHLVHLLELHELLGLHSGLLGPVGALAAIVAVLGATSSLDAQQCAPLYLRSGTQTI